MRQTDKTLDLFAGVGGMGTLMKNFKTTLDSVLMSVDDFHNEIVSDKHKVEVTAIRDAKARGEETRALKDKLNLYVCAGDVTKRRKLEGLANPTGYAPIDIDDITEEKKEEIMAKLPGIKWVKEGHRSCSNLGIHMIVAMGKICGYDLSTEEGQKAYSIDFKKRYAEITKEVKRIFDVDIDEQCKDALRGLYPSWDPMAYLRPDEEVEVFPFNDNDDPSTGSGQAHNDNLPTNSGLAQSNNSVNESNPTATSATATVISNSSPRGGQEGVTPFNPQLIKSYVPMHQYKPSKRHNWWIGFAQYLKWKGVPQSQLDFYQDMMKAHLMMCGHIQADDPCMRSATEVKEAMAWGFEHSDTEDERKTSEVFVEKVNEMVAAYDDTEFRVNMRQLLRGVIGLKQSIQGVPDATIMPIICGIMSLAMAYATDVKVRYCDGKIIRLNGMSMIIGGQGGKKSSVKFKLDIWKQPLREADHKARQKFDEYKQKRKNRRANDKLEPEPTDTIIEVPITISCSTLLKRMKNARGKHLFSFCEELDTLRKTNGAGSWSSKYDVYRLSFDNGEWGQDYNSDQAESGVVETAYNWTILGTQGAFEKCFTADNVENGLGGRILLARMPSSEYEYMPTYKDEPQADVECILKAVDILRGASGMYEMPRMCKRMTKWCNEKADEAREHDDKVMDTFRKRAAVIGFRCGVIYHLLEQRDTESNNCLAFAELMAEYCLKNQCEMLGGILMNTATRINDGTGYRSRNKTLFEELSDEFDWDTIIKLRPQTKYNALRNMIYKWKKDELIDEVCKNRWRKKIQPEA